MAKAYVVKQQKPKSDQRKQAFKENSLFFLKSLISNDTCVEARKKPWYAAVIIALFSILIAMIVVVYSAFTTTGATFLNTPLYNLDNSLVDFDQTLVTKNLSLTVSDKLMSITGGSASWEAAFPTTTTLKQSNPNNAYVHEFTQTVIIDPRTTSSAATSSSSSVSSSVPTEPYKTDKVVVDLAVYWAGSTAIDDYYSTFVWKRAGDFPTSTSKTNIIVLNETGFAAYKLPTSNTVQASKIQGKWDSSWVNDPTRVFDLKSLATTSSHGVAYTGSTAADLSNNTIAAWKEIFADGYETTKVKSAWISTGIYFGVYAGLTLILGLTVFLMTRGKTNPFRIYTFWECQKIAYWAGLSPALLGLFGFLAPSYAPLIFIFLYGMRVMWMSMKSLRPVYNS